MSAFIVLGAQWGDEGKGKMTDYLAEEAEVIVRYQGGNNAGHTVEVEDKQYKLHLIPSGILHDEKLNVIGNGVVVDPVALFDEIEYLEKDGCFRRRRRCSTTTVSAWRTRCMPDGMDAVHRGARSVRTKGEQMYPCGRESYKMHAKSIPGSFSGKRRTGPRIRRNRIPPCRKTAYGRTRATPKASHKAGYFRSPSPRAFR